MTTRQSIAFATIIDNLRTCHGSSDTVQHYALFFKAGNIQWWEKVGHVDKLYC